MPSAKVKSYLEEQLAGLYTGKTVSRDNDGNETMVDLPEEMVLSANQKAAVESWVANIKDFEKHSLKLHVLANRTRRFEMVDGTNNMVSWLADDEYNQPIIDKQAEFIAKQEQVDREIRTEVEAEKRRKVQEAQKKAIEEEKEREEKPEKEVVENKISDVEVSG
ncbi:MAG: hypothetical protein ACPGTI_07880 [bacterium]